MENRLATSRELLEAATRISPLNPIARLARAQVNVKSQPIGSLIPHLGLSRDVASLAWSARQLRLAHEKTAAIRLYRQALELNCRRDKASYLGVAFNDDPKVRRFFLPGEDACLMMIRELAVDSGWTYQEWSQAVPNDSVALLAMARILREQGRHEAEDVAGDVLDRLEPTLATPGERAIREAANAEAYAMLSDWRKAEGQYMIAISHIDDLTIRRSWWFNLAIIALHADDDVQRRSAIQAAIDVTNNDVISRCALELQRSSTVVGPYSPKGMKAN